jgi:hypothetical protein
MARSRSRRTPSTSASAPNAGVAPGVRDPAYDAAFEEGMLERVPPPNVLSIGLRAAGLVFVFGLSWRAIHFRGATAGSLLLPIAAELVAGAVIGIALGLVVVREREYRRQVVSSLWFWCVLIAVAFAWQWYTADHAGIVLQEQLGRALGDWRAYVVGHGMHWPMLAAVVSLVFATFSDVAAYRRRGPPFVYLASLNLGLRLMVVFVLCFWLMFAFDSNRRQRAEVMWFVLLAAEIFATWAPWAVQKKIRAQRAAAAAKRAGARPR